MVKTALAFFPFHVASADRPAWKRIVTKILLVMKLTMLLIGIALLSARASVTAQHVTLSGKDLALKHVFAAIKQQTGFVVFGKEELLKSAAPVSLDVHEIPLNELLELVLKGQGVTFEIREKAKTIVLSERERSSFYLQPVAFPVKGVVRTAEGTALFGASVRIKGVTKGTITDEYGRFNLDVEAGQVLLISFTGYVEREVKVNADGDLEVVLQRKDNALGEVVVNKGYYKEKQRFSTGNVARVDGKEIANQPVTSPLLALLGRVPGLEISAYNGSPGLAPKIRVRGESSISGVGGYPLYIVDGIFMDARELRSNMVPYLAGMDPLANINPEMIESIEVLKDADATAIYGSRGANGVIIITTKQAGRPGLEVSVNAYAGGSKMPVKLDLLNTLQYLEMRKEAFANAGTTPNQFQYDLVRWDSTRNTDWQDVLLGGTAHISDAQLNLSGGNSNTTFMLGAGYHKETMLVSRDFGLSQTNFNASFNHHSANQKFNIAFSAGYGTNKNKQANTSPIFENALTLAPNAPSLYKEDGTLNWDIIDYGTYKVAAFQNPLSELLKHTDMSQGTWTASASIGFQVAPGLDIKANMGYADASWEEIIKQPIGASPPQLIGANSTASAQFSNGIRRSWSAEPQITWSGDFGKSHLDLLAGATLQGSMGRYQSIIASGYTSDALLNSLVGATEHYFYADDYSQYRYAAVFARVGYRLKDRYLFNLTGRRDGSSRFGPGNQFGNFGALGAGWIFTEEKFMQNRSFLSFGKLRASYGITGNDQIGDYEYYDLYNIGFTTYQRSPVLDPVGLFNEDFQWESTGKLEAGLELGLLKDRIMLQAVWYRNVTSNQLVNYQLPFSTGFASIRTNFNASVENKGWEFTVQSRNIVRRNFSWNTSFNISFSKNKLLSFPGLETSPYAMQYKVGEPLNIQRHYVWLGVDPETGLHTFEDLNKDGVIDYYEKDVKFVNSMARRFYGGMSNNLQYKSFDLSFTLEFASTPALRPFWDYPGANISNQLVSVMNRWRKPGDKTDVARFSTKFADVIPYGFASLSNYSVVDGSFIKLRTLSLSYALPAKLLKVTPVKDARIFLQGLNLLTISNYPGLDPQTGNALPQLRSITGGINVKF